MKDPIFEVIRRIVDSTFIKEFVGQGKDSHKQKFETLQIVGLERIENVKLWRNYVHRREMIAHESQRHLSISPAIATADPFLSNGYNLRQELNEVFLFHGTKVDVVPVIINQGFEERVASLNGLFGAGCYFAENSSKSDEYVALDNLKQGYIFLSRVCLGTPYIAKKSMNSIRRPPLLPNNQQVADSVLGDCQRTGAKGAFLQRYREFIVYDRTQCYPEFLITYTRS